jgi:hypothetical protein
MGGQSQSTAIPLRKTDESDHDSTRPVMPSLTQNMYAGSCRTADRLPRDHRRRGGGSRLRADVLGDDSDSLHRFACRHEHLRRLLPVRCLLRPLCLRVTSVRSAILRASTK